MANRWRREEMRRQDFISCSSTIGKINMESGIVETE
jgi:hypothetical protein